MKSLYLAAFFLAHAISARAQEPAWSGSARCEMTTAGASYRDQQTHTWRIVPGAVTRRGAFTIYPGTWIVSGNGSFSRTTGEQSLSAQWTRSATMSAPISVVVRASDRALLIGASHAQLVAHRTVVGTQVQRQNGKVASTPIAADTYEFAFPSIVGKDSSTHLSGQTSTTPQGSFGLMQPGDSRTQVNCTWDFRRADDASGNPPPTTQPTAPPQAPPAPILSAPSCETKLAQSQATYDQMEAATELQYDKLLAENAATRAQRIAERADIDAQIQQLDGERAALEAQKSDAIAAVKRSAMRAATAIRNTCRATTYRP